jgi:hypothetical protein
VVVGAGQLMPPGTINLKPGLIKIIVGKEIPVDGLVDIKVLRQQTNEIMLEMITQESLPVSNF